MRLRKIEGKKRKRVTVDEIVGWHHRFNGHKLGRLGRDVRDGGSGVLQVQVVRKSWT